MADDIPTPCDLIVVGTGLVESIVASAASRIGKQVVHLDHRDFYGSSWATFSFNSLENTLGLTNKFTEHVPESQKEATDVNISLNSTPICNVVEKWFVLDECRTPSNDSKESEATSSEASRISWTKLELLKNSRKFNFDITPKLLYSRGEMVIVLISSGICRYAEFKTISGLYTFDDTEGCLLPVPCSRADVFNSKDITMVEKRLLMKMLTMCVNYENKPDEFKEYESGNFGNFLNTHKIQGKIRKYLVDSVAMANDSTSFKDAVKNVQKFVQSIGKYGNTPFLWTLYGSGELPQCFCRCSAVFGGVYCLKRNIEKITLDGEGQAVGIVSGNQTLKARFILIEDCLNPLATVKSGISRAILVTDKSLTSNEQAAVITVPSINGKDPVRIIELSASTMACPQGLYVVHLITRQVTTAVEDLQEAIDALFCSGENEALNKPNIIWSLHFNISEYDSHAGKLPPNVYSCPGPDPSIDFDGHVTIARNIFQSMYPGEDFLPKVPEPEDIILEGPSEDVVQERSLEDVELETSSEDKEPQEAHQ